MRGANTIGMLAALALAQCAARARRVSVAAPLAGGSPAAPDAAIAAEATVAAVAAVSASERPASFVCERTTVALPSSGAELDVPTAWIFSDAIVGASLLARERAARSEPSSAELHLRGPRGAVARVVRVRGAPAAMAPWRIEHREGLLRRCDDRGRCALYALDRREPIERDLPEPSALFALGASGSFVFAFESSRRALVRGPTPDAPDAPAVSTALDAPLVGLRLRDGLAVALVRRPPTDALADADRALALSEPRPCPEGATTIVGVLATRLRFGAFGPAMTARMELSTDARGELCASRLSGRATLGLVEASIDVAIGPDGAGAGLLRTARAVEAVRCALE